MSYPCIPAIKQMVRQNNIKKKNRLYKIMQYILRETFEHVIKEFSGIFLKKFISKLVKYEYLRILNQQIFRSKIDQI